MPGDNTAESHKRKADKYISQNVLFLFVSFQCDYNNILVALTFSHKMSKTEAYVQFVVLSKWSNIVFTTIKVSQRQMAEQVTNHRENLLQHVYPLKQRDRVPTWTNAIGRGRGDSTVRSATLQVSFFLFPLQSSVDDSLHELRNQIIDLFVPMAMCKLTVIYFDLFAGDVVVSVLRVTSEAGIIVEGRCI